MTGDPLWLVDQKDAATRTIDASHAFDRTAAPGPALAPGSVANTFRLAGMQVAVLGAGAMGGTIAALLHRAGHEVEITARGAQLVAIRDHGIRLGGAWGNHTAAVKAEARLTRRPGLAILATKAMDAPEAAAENAKLLDGVPLVVVQNGLGGLESVADAVPAATLIGALSLIAASLVAPGEIVVTTAAATWLGMPGTDASGFRHSAAPARFAAEALSTAIPCSVVDNFAGARWTKLIINQVNALPAITGLSVQDVVGHDGLRRLMTRSMREAARVGLARGIHFEEINGVTHGGLRILAHAPLRFAEYLPVQLRAYLGDVPNPGSTLQSIRRGQASEIDYLNGAVVWAGTGTGVSTRVNAGLVELVHEVERSWTFFTPDEVLKRFSRPAL